MHLLFILFLVIVLLDGVASSTAFDNSLKPQEEKIVGSKTHKSVADIVAKATGKLDKTKAKQTKLKNKEPVKRKRMISYIYWIVTLFCPLIAVVVLV